MVAVAVVGASSAVGQALVERLDADAGIERLVGVDVNPPAMPVARLEMRTMDPRDKLLPLALEDCDTVVHCAAGTEVGVAEDTLFARNVNGTRNILAAAAKCGVHQLVVISSGTVYGAHPDNPLPLPESAPRRANPDHPIAYQHLLVEELVDDWMAEQPVAAVAVLRPAVLLGPGVDDPFTRVLQAPVFPLIAGHPCPWQFAHVDDVAAAAHLALTQRLHGQFNVACHGWLSGEDVARLLGRRAVQVPPATAREVIRLLWERGIGAAPPGLLHYLMHPWVLETTALQEAGWEPEHTNRDTVREFAVAHHDEVALGRVVVRREQLRAAAAAAGLAVLLAVRGWRRWRRSVTAG